jgi:hypothetical protein
VAGIDSSKSIQKANEIWEKTEVASIEMSLREMAK